MIKPQPRDYLQTEEGLLFAVVSSTLTEHNSVICCLRYRATDNGYQKLATSEADALLQSQYPQYRYQHPQFDTIVHVVPIERISKHYSAVDQLRALFQCSNRDVLQQKAVDLAQLFIAKGIEAKCIGISGSLLTAVHGKASDIDLVIYGRAQFFKARLMLADLLKQGKVQSLSEELWRQTWQRRDSDLSFAEYSWHERRKLNKGSFQETKFDLTLVDTCLMDTETYQKTGVQQIQAKVLDDQYSYDYPAIYTIDHAQIKHIISYTATYAGQAVRGERIRATGIVEQSAGGQQRLLVGSSREARGESLRVIRTQAVAQQESR